MALDIFVQTKNRIYDEGDDQADYALSRTLCRLFLGTYKSPNPDHGELIQVGKLAGVDLTPLVRMGDYVTKDHEELLLANVADAGEKERLHQEIQQKRDGAWQPIPLVKGTVVALLNRLGEGVYAQIEYNENHREWLHPYFRDPQPGRDDEYAGNTFGQDLRNVLRYLEFAEQKGEAYVIFDFG
ncbi:MAG: hypothetical protein H7Z75_07660 [Ferruginibacter sp.]|nr:hypothetical protein [Cytophagales bacterium]